MHTKEIGVGIIGAGYMGKAHSVAMKSVGAVFNTALRPRCEMICTTSEGGAAKRASEFGFERSTADWEILVNDPKIDAVVIASPQSTHREISLAAFDAGKHVMCEKPLGEGLSDSRIMVEVAEKSGLVNMTAFNYIRTPASQLAREIIAAGEIGKITYFRGEHTEDFLADPDTPANWRTEARSTGNMGDLSPHPINAALALCGPIEALVADVETVHKTRPSENGKGNVEVKNDDHGQFLIRFESGVMGVLYSSRVATGRKMGYAYDIYGTKGSIRFDQEDQNALWLYKGDQASNRQGFTKLLTGPEHPDYVNFCPGPGHGSGYQEQITIEARDFLKAIETGKAVWPTFRDAMEVNRVIEAAWRSQETRSWVNIKEV